MARKLTFGGFKSPRLPRIGAASLRSGKPKSSPALLKPEELPVPRRYDIERGLCDAIAARKLVTFRYDNDLAERTFAPHAVFVSTKSKICVSGVQINNPTQPLNRLEPRDFEVGKIQDFNITGQDFNPDSRFDRTNLKYRNGIICLI